MLSRQWLARALAWLPPDELPRSPGNTISQVGLENVFGRSRPLSGPPPNGQLSARQDLKPGQPLACSKGAVVARSEPAQAAGAMSIIREPRIRSKRVPAGHNKRGPPS